jgi:hypothetical protein
MFSALEDFDIGDQSSDIWWVGDENKTLYKPSYPHTNYCELWNPKNERVTGVSDCRYTHKIVTDADAGDWKFVFGIKGKLLEDTIDKKIIVKKGKGTS